jgi:hypothetical protein
MAVSPKVERLHASRLPDNLAVTPTRHLVNGLINGNKNDKIGKSKPKRARAVDLSPRLELGLSLHCEILTVSAD